MQQHLSKHQAPDAMTRSPLLAALAWTLLTSFGPAPASCFQPARPLSSSSPKRCGHERRRVPAFSASRPPSARGVVLDSSSSSSPSRAARDDVDDAERSRAVDNPARVAFVAGTAPSGYGRTSPSPDPSWSTVAAQLSRRLPNFADVGAIEAVPLDASDLDPDDLAGYDVVVALGVRGEDEERRLGEAMRSSASTDDGSPKALLADTTCGSDARSLRRAGSYRSSSVIDDAIATVAPWSGVASGKRLVEKSDVLLGRKSSEDYIFATLFALHSLVTPLDVVKSDINPSWEKGPLRNAREFARMCDKCGPQIFAALTDPQTKKAVDLLNAVDLRDQVGSYRVIVSNETPELEDFTLCILQQNDCFGCDAPILDRPAVPLVKEWRGRQLDDDAARRILVGHLDHPAADPEFSRRKGWSWKIVVGANPAYDAFPMQHQIFYPPEKEGSSSLWYDPVFCVETLDGELVWCKRHYRCTPRKHWSDETDAKSTPGAWTLTTLDNGMVSEEKWTTVDVADDLSWAVLHYSGAARRAGQSYVGALLCTPDGKWPSSCASGKGLERIRDAFRKCDLELWELFGGSTEESYMWSEKFTGWAEQHPPPLERIGDMSITSWRKREREKALAAKAT